MHAYLPTYMHTYIHTYIPAYLHTYTYTYIYQLIYLHTSLPVFRIFGSLAFHEAPDFDVAGARRLLSAWQVHRDEGDVEKGMWEQLKQVGQFCKVGPLEVPTIVRNPLSKGA